MNISDDIKGNKSSRRPRNQGVQNHVGSSPKSPRKDTKEISMVDCFARYNQLQKKDEQMFEKTEQTRINLQNANKEYLKSKEHGEKSAQEQRAQGSNRPQETAPEKSQLTSNLRIIQAQS